MTRCYWVSVVAVIGLILTGSIEGKDIDRTTSGHHNQSQTSHRPTNSGSPTLPPSVQTDIKRIAGALEAESHRPPSDYDRRNAEAQEKVVWWTPWIAGVATAEMAVTLVGVILVGLTLYHTKRAADAAQESTKAAWAAAVTSSKGVSVTREIGQKQVKSYLHCVEVRYVTNRMGIWCWPVIKNTGQSPARKIEIDATITLWLTDLDGNTTVKELHPGRTSQVSPIPANGSDNGMLVFENPAATVRNLPPRDILNPVFRIAGFISWEDVFGNSDSIGFTLHKIGEAEITDDGARAEGHLGIQHSTPVHLSDLADEKLPEDGENKS